MNQVLSGDYANKLIVDTGHLRIDVSFLKSIYLNKETVKFYEVVNQESAKSAKSGAVRGVVGSALLGPVGMLAGVASAKSNNTYLVAVEMRDGKKFLAQLDSAAYKVLVVDCFGLEYKKEDVPSTIEQNTGAVSFCSNCGSKLLADVKFCSSCGTAVIRENSEQSNNITSSPVETPTQNFAETKTVEEEPQVDLKAEAKEIKETFKSEYTKAKAEISSEIKTLNNTIKNQNNRKTYTEKQIKKFFMIAIVVAAVLSILMVVAMHTEGDPISTDIFMFILCTFVLSIPTVLGTLLICLPSIRKNRKEKKDK